ncbi:RadC family protein [Gemelliphila palaticanis]|uniref:DNA repair protein RadC n=1 Tax=Gemelliphila palaticanis TaxID=81950 RepID=A0ABX2T160_9BACL|nr:DNA repair protein RadC [Gemella palaticanis]MBF0715015.1 DNA repair protein RadC [Gemella palaticanis]NYS46945.1 DNA repair protein RadC [Gemella palaticanis]
MVKNITIKEIEKEDRPREKLRKIGASNLSDKELLAIMLRTGTKNLNVVQLADKILKDVGDISNLKNVTYNELLAHKGIGSVKAVDILASIEFVRRIFTINVDKKIICDNPDTIANYLRYKVQELKQEVFITIDIDTKGKIIAEREVFKGSLSSSIAHPREIFKDAIKNSSSSIICVHNHPSGDATPSVEDIKLTHRLFETGKIVGIDVLDHIIIAKKGYCSIRKFFNYIERENIAIDSISQNSIKYLTKKYELLNKY